MVPVLILAAHKDRKTEGDLRGGLQQGFPSASASMVSCSSSRTRRRSTSTSATRSRSWSIGWSCAERTTRARPSARPPDPDAGRLPIRSKPRCASVRASSWSLRRTPGPSRSSASVSTTAARSTAPRSRSSSRATSASTRRMGPAPIAPASAFGSRSTRIGSCRIEASPSPTALLRPWARTPMADQVRQGGRGIACPTAGTRRAHQRVAAGALDHLPNVEAKSRSSSATATSVARTPTRRPSKASSQPCPALPETESEYVKTELERSWSSALPVAAARPSPPRRSG